MLPLHGGLPPSQQARVFNRPPKGKAGWVWGLALSLCMPPAPHCSLRLLYVSSRAQLHLHQGARTIKCLSPLFSAPGTVKIVVSTNVAETSITIDDVTAVIDTGRVKEMRFDAARGIARLQETFVSQVDAGSGLDSRLNSNSRLNSRCLATGRLATCSSRGQDMLHSCIPGGHACKPVYAPHPTLETPCPPLPTQAAAQQRRGRAGRVRPGVCYRLFSRRTLGRMPRDTPPEIARAPLQVGTCSLWIPAFC